MKKMKKLLILLSVILSLTAPAAALVIGTLSTTESVSAAVHINRSKITLAKGQTKKLSITGTARPAKWSSSNRSVVTVNKKGKITGKKKGTAVITAKVLKKKYTCRVTVKTYASQTKKCFRLDIGHTLPLKIRADWKSSDYQIATVSKTGLIHAVHAGICEVSATVKYHHYVYVIKVPDAPDSSTLIPVPTIITTLTPTPAATNTPGPVLTVTNTPKPTLTVTTTPKPTLAITTTPKPTLTVTTTPRPTLTVTNTPKPGPIVSNTPVPTPVISTTPRPTLVITATPTPLPPQSLVWLSRTGEKYHKIPKCGNMDPANARQVTLNEALRLGYPPCEKCF